MKKLPVISIIGRQNVGKSTLFNRLIKSKKSIIDSTPGVTRDLVFGEMEWEEKLYKLIDSGGISDDEDITNMLVQKKTNEALDKGDLILFVVEASNPVPVEEEYLLLARKSGKKTIIAMNKSDSPEKDVYANEFYKYGLGEPIPISAAHNRNIDVLMEKIEEEIAKVDLSFDEEKKIDVDLKIAILGKPNVGKSSLLNKIADKERSIVSSIAGTTRDIIDEEIEFAGKKLLMLDTAGIRRKSKVTENVEYYSVNRAIKTITYADVVFLLVDSLEDITDQDKKIFEQIIKNGKGLLLALNKWDLQEDRKGVFEEKLDSVMFKFPILKYVPIIPISAKTGMGVKRILKTALKIKEELHKRIETADLNDFIQKVVKQYAPSSKRGVLRIYYGAQTRTAPVEFVFFINKKSLLSNNYQQYIINRIRDHFGYTGIPIRVIFKDKKQKRND